MLRSVADSKRVSLQFRIVLHRQQCYSFFTSCVCFEAAADPPSSDVGTALKRPVRACDIPGADYNSPRSEFVAIPLGLHSYTSRVNARRLSWSGESLWWRLCATSRISAEFESPESRAV